MNRKKQLPDTELILAITKSFEEVRAMITSLEADTDRRLLMIERMLSALTDTLGTRANGPAEELAQEYTASPKTRFDQLIRRNQAS